MARSGRHRELLVADLALESSDAGPQEIAAALRRSWDEDDGPSVSLQLLRSGAIDETTRARIESEVDLLLRRCDGNAQLALARRGGIDRSIHSGLDGEFSKELVESGAGMRAPFRTIDPERYQDFTLIGRGGMGVVYLALDTELNRHVALKMVVPDPAGGRGTPAPETPLMATPPAKEDPDRLHSFEELRTRFVQETWITAAMEHPGVVPVYELGATDMGIPYYTMRYVKGERTLAIAIRDATELETRLSLLEPFLKVCDAVRYAHARGIVHRDLKPDNVGLGEFGEAVVLDWGLSKVRDQPDVAGKRWRTRMEEYRSAADLHTVAGALGTAGYMAPEAAIGEGDGVDAQSDIYSLGAMLFQILTGRLPYEFKSFIEYVNLILQEDPPAAHEVDPAVPRELARIAARALAREKSERFESVSELAARIRRWQTEGPVEREVERLMASIQQELDASHGLRGNFLLWHLDRATAACSQLLHLRPDHEQALTLQKEIKGSRERGIRERVRGFRQRVIFAVGFGALAIATIVALSVVGFLAEQRREAEESVRIEKDRAASFAAEARKARAAARTARGERANWYAALARSHAREGRVAAARLAASKALHVESTPEGWAAWAEAEARWTPTLRLILRDLDPTALAFHPDGERIFIACSIEGPVIRMYDLATAEMKAELWGHVGGIRFLAISRDGAIVCAASHEPPITVWDAESGELIRDVGPDPLALANEMSAAGPITALAFARDGQSIFTGHREGAIAQWNVRRGTIAYFLQRNGVAVTALHAGRGGRYLYCGDSSGDFARREIGRLDRSVVVGTGEECPLLQVLPAEDGDTIHVCNASLRMIMIELDPPRVYTNADLPHSQAQVVRFATDFSRVYSADRSGSVHVWDIEARKLLARIGGTGSGLRALALSPDDRRLALGLEDGTVRVWALIPGRQPPESKRANAVIVSEDGARTYVARLDHAIDIWDSQESRCVERLDGHEATVTALALDTERDLLYTAALDGTLRIWDISAARLRTTIQTAEEPITALATVPGKELVFAGTLTGEVQLWNCSRRRKMAQFGEKGLPIGALRLEDERLLALDVGGVVRAWNAETHKPLPGQQMSFSLPDSAAPVLGAREPWAFKDPLRRLIENENRFGLRLAGFEVVRVPAEQFLPHLSRLEPWSD